MSRTITEVEKSMDQIYKRKEVRDYKINVFEQDDDEYDDHEEEKVPRAHTEGAMSSRDYNNDVQIADNKRKNNNVKMGSISMKQHLP